MIDDVELEDIQDIEAHIEFIVPQTDDPSTPAFTFRAIFIGTIFCVLISFANTALSFRANAITVPPVVATILSYPLGVFFSKVLPSGFLNPGPFSLKEHVLIYVMSSTSNANGGLPYGIDNVVSQTYSELMGNTDITFISALGFVLITQFLGYGISGLTRRFLVRPTAMWWPGNLTNIALFVSFHKVSTGDVAGERYKMSRFMFFWIAFAGMFAYEWLPTVFLQALGAISITCLFAGRGNGPSGVLSQYNAVAGSVYNGVGLFGITLDWNNVQLGGTNFAQPFSANLCNNLGNIFFLWILTPLFYTSDMFGLNSKFRENGYQGSLNPKINSAHLFVGAEGGPKKQGSRVSNLFFYNVSDNYNLNVTAYNLVAPIHLSSAFTLTYASSFLTVTAAISHVALWYGKDLYRQSMNAFRQIRDEIDSMDKHVVMMEAYPDVPDWAYLAFLAVCSVGGVLVSVFTPFNMPWWGVFFNIFIVSVMVVPYGAVQAITGIGLYINVLTEFIIGLMIPGQTVAVMAFKSWGTNSLIQSLQLSQDLKIGQYLHIPPYAMVGAQFLGTLINAVVATGAAWFMMFNSGDLLTKDEWSYVNYQVFYAAGGIWGAIGPQRFFGIGSIYASLMWCFLIGALCPFLPWLANKFIYKSKYWHLVNFPLFFSFNGVVGFQVLIVVPMIINFVSQIVLYNKNKEFFQKYAYVLGAAFDSSAAIVALIWSMMQVGGLNWTSYNVLNPNTDNVPGDYYCYPGASYADWDCSYYITKGTNQLADGTPCSV
ncbi:OPT superfamily oligopeptide transporter [Rhizoclosmatium globosum]|uniref:OPT superfamily oligopeptide transporter n=1 Tax=Rhizoclosmatium globosum TaxID=329046 RepID=A0A1Y2CFB7_9FUNG|nr:OPT superfamily oligopeptide transporter [Rhizoclosmatium globosum]|eukprot:ORY45751.1 OPT superfamily oligopeptide transporter [Rhizoclosmatium globosum]